MSYFGDTDDRNCGFSVAEALDVIQALERRGIPTCVTGEKALLSCGVRKVARVRPSQDEQSLTKLPPLNWKFSVPDDLFEEAKTLFAERASRLYAAEACYARAQVAHPHLPRSLKYRGPSSLSSSS